jgi:phosphonate transport system ATP-binding protein
MSAASLNGSHLIEADGISKSYGRVQALAPMSITIGQGERVALAGPSGSGKTTLLYLLAGVIQPDSGDLLLGGQDLTRQKPGKEKAGLVGLIHQQYDLVPHLSVLHNVLAGRLGQWSLFRSLISLVWPQDRHVAEAALAQMGIADKIHERTSHLSGGEQQRVAMARLMLQGSRVILADEPVSSLDPARAEDLLEILTALASDSDKTLIASIHAPHLMRKHFSRVIGLREGRIEFDIPSEEVTDQVLEKLYDLDRSEPFVWGGGN